MESMRTNKLPRLLNIPSFVRFGIHIDSAAAWRWLALLAVALWPTWWWIGRRMAEDSDVPLGALALATLVATLLQHRARLRAAPRLGLQVCALAGAVLTTALYNQAPDGLSGLIGMASLTAGLIAFLPAHVATAPVLGLSAMSLPLPKLLQTCVGHPLGLVTAEAIRWALSAAHTVTRSGADLVVDGLPVIVDAACSGLQLTWLGLFTACTVALVARCGNRTFLLKLPVVGVLLLFGNILRNTVEIALQTASVPVPHWLQATMGPLVVATICAAIAVHMRYTPAYKGQPTP